MRIACSKQSHFLVISVVVCLLHLTTAQAAHAISKRAAGGDTCLVQLYDIIMWYHDLWLDCCSRDFCEPESLSAGRHGIPSLATGEQNQGKRRQRGMGVKLVFIKEQQEKR